MKNNRLLSLIVALFSIVFLGGCASVDYSRFVNPNGEITDRIVVEVSEQAIAKCSLSKQELYAQIVNDFENLYVQPIEDFVYAFVNAKAHNPADVELVKNGISTNVEVIENRIVCDVVFKNERVMLLYLNNGQEPSKSEQQQVELRKGLFVNKYVTKSLSVFAVIKQTEVQKLVQKYSTYFNSQFSLSDVLLTQVFASANTNLRSNANEIQTTDGIKMHQWEIDPNNLDFELEFFAVAPAPVAWYVVAMFLSLVVTFVVWGINRQRKTKENID